MTNGDRKWFAVEMALLAEMFGEQLSETRLEIYFEDLKIYDWEHVRDGIRVARRSRKFFPKVVDICECIDEAVEARVQSHVMAVKRDHSPLPPGSRMGLQRAGDLFQLPPKPDA